MSTALEAASLIMIPTSYSDGLLASVKPNDGAGDFTFSRGSNLSATRVNADGNIEKGYENLLLQSNTFDITWARFNASPPINGYEGYDGGNDAWLLSKTGAAGQIIQSISLSGVQTFSFYAKAGTLNWARITLGGVGTTFVNISNGTFGVDQSISSSTEDAGNGWYRISCTFNGASTEVTIFPADGDNDVSGTSGSIYIQDAMLNQGLVAYPYVETTTAPVAAGILEDMPRIDFSGGNQSLLLEPSRTNIIGSSEYLSTGYSSIAGVSFIQNTTETLSPEGKYNATKLTGIGNWRAWKYIAPDSLNATLSIYVKAVDPNSNNLFRIKTGSSYSNDLQATSDWQRFDFTSINDNFFQGLTFSSTNINCDLYIYGMQYEQDATYPTSYIPTYGVSQTRLQDLAAASNVASLIGQTEGVFYVNIESLTTLSTGEYRFINLENNFVNRITLGYFNNSDLFVEIKTNNVTELYYRNTTSPDQKNKMTIAYKENDCRVFINGQKVYTDNSVTLPIQLNKLSLDTGSFKFYGKVDGILTFPAALSDEECIALTTI